MAPSTTSPAGYHVSCSFACPTLTSYAGKNQDAEFSIAEHILGAGDDRKECEAKMEDMLAVSGDAKWVIRCINARVSNAVESLTSMYSERKA